MTEKLFDALETCLRAIDQGETVDLALKRFPALADELRPILEASLHATSLAGEAVAEDVHRRGRARLLQRAAELREAKRSPRKRTWIFTLRPVAVTLMVAIFLLSGTGLVRASSTALPGDNLYRVKRTWEDFTLIFVSGIERDDLELTYETERVEEINELLTKGRDEVVTFSGYVTSQTQSQWTVAGVPVLITVDTSLPAEPVSVGAGVTISGQTNELGFLVAQSIETVAPGTVIPEIEVEENEDEHEEDDEENEALQNPLTNDDSANPSGGDSGSSEDDLKRRESKLKGILEAVNGRLWVVDGKDVDVSDAVIVGTPAAGAEVIVEGYYNADGVFIATKVTFLIDGEDSSGSEDDSSGSKLGDRDNDDDNDNEDDHEDNENNDNGSDDGEENSNED